MQRMTRRGFAVLVGLALGGMVVCSGVHAQSPVQLAAQSCKSFQNTCAARCKQRVPDDKNCVSDHCTPKLEACRIDGCWEEGKLYGGKRTCGLTKT